MYYEGKSVYGPILLFWSWCKQLGLFGLGEFVGYVHDFIRYFLIRLNNSLVYCCNRLRYADFSADVGICGNCSMQQCLFFERTGKVIRSSARDAVLSHATSVVGRVVTVQEVPTTELYGPDLPPHLP